MPRKQTVISLDPIDRKKEKGFLGRLLVTRYGGGKPIKISEPYGHYLFSGSQGSGKTASALWYSEKLAKKYKKKGKSVEFFSNIGIGIAIDSNNLFDTINSLQPTDKEIRIVIIDEIHTYFPKDGMSKKQKDQLHKMIALFSQLRKRSCFVLTTAQVYGRLEKSLREQCLYMVACKTTVSNKLCNDFIPGDDIICDDLGRWAGDPKFIYKHGLAKTVYDTKKIING